MELQEANIISMRGLTRNSARAEDRKMTLTLYNDIAGEVNRISDNIMEISIRSRSRVVSVKLDETTIHILDKQVRRINARSRSEVIKALIKAFVYAMSELEARTNSEPYRLKIVVSVEDEFTGKTGKVIVKLPDTSVIRY